MTSSQTHVLVLNGHYIMYVTPFVICYSYRPDESVLTKFRVEMAWVEPNIYGSKGKGFDCFLFILYYAKLYLDLHEC